MDNSGLVRIFEDTRLLIAGSDGCGTGWGSDGSARRCIRVGDEPADRVVDGPAQERHLVDIQQHFDGAHVDVDAQIQQRHFPLSFQLNSVLIATWIRVRLHFTLRTKDFEGFLRIFKEFQGFFLGSQSMSLGYYSGFRRIVWGLSWVESSGILKDRKDFLGSALYEGFQGILKDSSGF